MSLPLFETRSTQKKMEKPVLQSCYFSNFRHKNKKNIDVTQGFCKTFPHFILTIRSILRYSIRFSMYVFSNTFSFICSKSMYLLANSFDVCFLKSNTEKKVEAVLFSGHFKESLVCNVTRVIVV